MFDFFPFCSCALFTILPARESDTGFVVVAVIMVVFVVVIVDAGQCSQFDIQLENQPTDQPINRPTDQPTNRLLVGYGVWIQQVIKLVQLWKDDDPGAAIRCSSCGRLIRG